MHYLAELYERGGKKEQAEALFARAFELARAIEENPALAASDAISIKPAFILADLYRRQGKPEQAASVYETLQPLLRTATPAPRSRRKVEALMGYVSVLRTLGKQDRAEEVERLVRTICQ